MGFVLEIATTDFISTKMAVAGGADRIELCAALSEGGTTPSQGMIRQCRERFDVSLFPIVRPRGGDFLYSEEEFHVMLDDVKLCRQLGCEGVVLGLLQANGEIDVRRTALLVNAAYPLEVTFHRAFDRCRDPFAALEQLVELGVQRLLTSGQKPAAPEGAELIAELVKAAGERIIIMPGSGVRKENLPELVKKTGAVEYHTSLRSRTASAMQFRHPSFSEEETFNPYIDPAEVREMKTLLQQLEQNQE